jgi:hypothetical protein
METDLKKRALWKRERYGQENVMEKENVIKKFSLISLAIFFVMAQGGTQAGAWDETEQEKLKLNLRNLLSPTKSRGEASAQAGFRFDNFKLTNEAGGMATWEVNVISDQAIGGNTFAVKTAFVGKTGATLFTGEDILLPASNAGKKLLLTRDFRLQLGIASVASVRFDVFDRTKGSAVHSQSYPLTADALVILDAARPDRTSVGSVLPAPNIPQAGELKYALRLNPAEHPTETQNSFELRNESAFPLRIEEAVARYRFPGLDGREKVACGSSVLQPGQATTCALEQRRMACSSLSAIDIELKLNGMRLEERLVFEPMLRDIPTQPWIEISKPMNKGYGQVKIGFTGQYVRPGTSVIVKALASVDSDRFPVVFRADQRESEIFGIEFPVGPNLNTKVERFCFHLQEVTTDDSMICGGVGHLLYRNWNRGMIPTESSTGNLFLHNKLCK